MQLRVIVYGADCWLLLEVVITHMPCRVIAEIATVIAPYDATSSEQLPLQLGQLIQIRRKTDTGWWEGELQVCQVNVFALVC